ncbi:baseplate J/gp47 family protein [Providencia sneebia]|uniref:Baseplate protein J-like barrel domain-containing protein n=1 Tax=Providencia sneebia DSM 19967 TaxID=1141660 RepID=K8W736_9GAMM|nr:baseplate J/gp47 family protein [Providencia sneebia]EKT56418.1 hypothetical protein OO7_10782 [Providencia sneebia DSM 19967]
MIPKLEITQQGIIAPTTQEVIDGLWSLMKGAFGEKLNVSMDTPQGQLVTTLAAIITDERNQLIELFNQFDPRYADGQMQDAIGYLYFLQRKQATKSVAELTFNGLSGVTIPSGFQILDEAGLYWSTTGESRIGANGLATVNASCNTAGMVSAQPNTINRIVRNISGLDSVTNNTAAAIGRNAESRQEFELRREQSVAKNAKNTNDATYGAVNNIKDVIDCYVVDNPSDNTITVGVTNYALIRNSIAVSVVGGDDNEIAKQILIKAGTGCSFVGNTTVTYQDTVNFPYLPPSYEIKFIRPAPIPVQFIVTYQDATKVTSQEKETIKKAILNEFTSGRGKGQIAKRLIASDYVCSVSGMSANRMIDIMVSRDSGAPVTYLDFGIDEYPVLAEDDIRIE